MKGIQEVRKGDGVGLQFTEQNLLEGDMLFSGEGFKFGKQVGATKQDLTYAATVTADCRYANIFDLTLTGNVTSFGIKYPQIGTTYLFLIRQDTSGSHTVTFSSDFHFESGTAPTITTTASAVDVVSAVYDGTVLLCSIIQDVKATS